jgi:sulfatase modifying factor 1
MSTSTSRRAPTQPTWRQRGLPKPPYPGMVWIPGGEFRMGSDHHYAEEAPAHRVRVDGFWMDRYPVTNERFAQFVAQCSYVTFAERVPTAADYPDALSDLLFPGSLVFDPPARVTDHHQPAWWHFRRGADWRHPTGPDSSIEGLEQHPVVHVTYGDALAFAEWQGHALPTEAEWERAARGGLEEAVYAWGDELRPDGTLMANIWQGDFPRCNSMEDGYARTSPVGAFPANGYGLYDMIGNVWEWTSDWYRSRHAPERVKSCCIPHNPRIADPDESYDPRETGVHVARKVLKGGSHLCAPNYCRRYRPAARFPEPVDTSACHVGFRCIVRPGADGAPPAY